MKYIKLPVWKHKTLYEKILTIIIVIVAVLLIATCILKIIDKWFLPDIIYQGLIFCLLLVESLIYKKYDKLSYRYLLVLSFISLVLLLISIFI